MELLYKPDWEQTKQNYIAWWDRQDFGRCGLAVTAPKSGKEHLEPPTPPEDMSARWRDHDYLARMNTYRMETTYYGADAIPVWNPRYCWENVGIYMRGTLDGVTFDENTAWTKPIIADGELTDHDYRQFKLSFDAETWK